EAISLRPFSREAQPRHHNESHSKLMLTEPGCQARRARLWKQLPREITWALISDPAHLTYFAGFHASPFVFNSQGATAALLLGREGASILVADNVQQPFAERAFVSECVAPVWYRCVESAPDRRDLVAQSVIGRLARCQGD